MARRGHKQWIVGAQHGAEWYERAVAGEGKGKGEGEGEGVGSLRTLT
jgi:hypothetical protein